MIGDLFDSPWKILIIAVVILVLFGSKKLPAAAKSLGESMRVLKKEVSKMHDEGDEHPADPTSTAAVGPAPAPAQIADQHQVDVLQQQIEELRRQQAPAEPPQTHQVS
jgi:sec-independent protein translocase protein TatA